MVDLKEKHPLIRTFQSFVRLESASGLLLLASAILALIWANSPLAELYMELWETVLTIGVGSFAISESLLHWINDGLMAVFFFVVGLEIKREVLTGELSTPGEAAFPLVAAVGGMLLPAAAYALLNWHTAALSGWGIPMATDIAFALGVLTLLGDRVPVSLKVFLTALAIVDDLGAVLVIALFYTAELSWTALGVGGAFFLALLLINRLRIRALTVYILLGLGLWVAVFESGVHATVAGVLLALTIPARRRIDVPVFLERGRELINRFAKESAEDQTDPTDAQQDVIHSLEEACEEIQTPLTRFEHGLHPWVAFFILPVFALANAGVVLTGEMLGTAFGSTVTLGIVLGLVLGKQIGVTLFAWLAVRLRWAALPANVTWQQVYGVAWLTGIGFTMSLFISNLAFQEAVMLDRAKIGILTASLISGVGGWLLLSRS